MSEFSQARDLLLVKLTLLTGPMENVILKDWQTAEVCDGVKVLLVPKHKQSRSGPAPLACDPDLQRLMEIYLEKVRLHFFAEERIRNVFVKNDGFPFERGTIGRRFTVFWEKTGIREVRTSQTILRKMYTTHTNKHVPKESGNIQKVLCHGEKSSRNCYLRDDLTVATAEAVNTLKAVTTIPLPKTLMTSKILATSSNSSQSTPIPAATPSASPASLTPPPPPATQTQSPPPPGSLTPPPPTQEPEDHSATSAQKCGSSSDIIHLSVKYTSLNPPLNEQQKTVALKLFSLDISNGQKLGKSYVKHKMCTESILQKISSKPVMVKRVQNLLNYEIEKQKPDPSELPKEARSVDDWRRGNNTATTLSVRSGPRSYWDENDTKTIREAFKDCDRCPDKDIKI